MHQQALLIQCTSMVYQFLLLKASSSEAMKRCSAFLALPSATVRSMASRQIMVGCCCWGGCCGLFVSLFALRGLVGVGVCFFLWRKGAWNWLGIMSATQCVRIALITLVHMSHFLSHNCHTTIITG